MRPLPRPPRPRARPCRTAARASGGGGDPARTARPPRAPPTPPAPSSSSSAPPPPPLPPTRLFSNLDADLRHAPGSVAGAAALVAGTAVGAGVLALPAVTAPVGVPGAAAALVGAWAFSLATGLLLAEVQLAALCTLGRGGASLGDLAEATVGRAAARAARALYVFLHVCLLVAYFARGGETVAGLLHVPLPVGAAAFGAVLAAPCALLPAAALDAANGALVAAVAAVFVALIALAAPGVDPAALTAPPDWGALPRCLPTVALAFVFQNVVPVVVSSLEGDAAKVRTALVAGTAAPLAMFLVWTAIVNGNGALAAATTVDAADPLLALADALPAPGGALVAAFSLLAVGTSFIGFVLGLTDFVGQELAVPARSPLPYALTLLPPYLGALAAPGVFGAALSAAGTYGVLTLFGVLPAAMAGAARRAAGGGAAAAPLVPGGDAVLWGVGATAAAVIVNETAARCGWVG